MTDNWKALLLLFLCFCLVASFFLFFCFFFVLFLFFFLCVFFGGFKGQVRWPEGPPHLALNPPSGHLTWPLNPPYLLFFCFFCFFLSFLCFLIHKNPCFSLEKGIFCLFLSVSLCFSLAFFGLPLFLFLFLCLCLVLVLFSSFLSSFFAFFWFLVFVSFFPFLSSLLLVHENEQHQNIKLHLFSSSIFSLFWFPVLFFLSNPLFLSLLFPDFKLCFCSTSMVFVSKQTA